MVLTDFFSGLDVLVNNAAFGQFASIGESTDEMSSQVFAVNFFAPLALTREALPHIRKVKGNVIFISSVGGK